MFIPTTEDQRREMLKAIGVSSLEELLSAIPASVRNPAFHLPPALTEMELARRMRELGSANQTLLSFLGAGAQEHFIPAAVWALTLRGEFATAYTPYQPEASQGTLQVIYEFQSMVCQLFQMDVANASVYEGGSALAEAAGAAMHATERKKILYSGSLHPHYRRTLSTYYHSLPDVTLEEVEAPQGIWDLKALEKRLDKTVAAVVVSNPNFFGCLEPVDEISKLAHGNGALLIAAVDPVSLGIVKAPGEYGADIAVGEGQGLGIPLSFGGPYLGLFTCRQELLRRMPGRICGMTQDREGRRGFVLTLQAREQHIRREKAASNICTNQALCATAATIYMSLLGPEGFRELAELNLQTAHEAAGRLEKLPGFKLKFQAPFYNEFVLECPRPAREIQSVLLKKGILPGLCLEEFYPQMKNCLLICATETKNMEDIERLVEGLKDAS